MKPLFLALSLAMFGTAYAEDSHYATILKEFNSEGPWDAITYSDLNNMKCRAVSNREKMRIGSAAFHLYAGQIYWEAKAAYTIPAVPEHIEYPNGPLLPPVTIPAKPEVHVAEVPELMQGRVFLEQNGWGEYDHEFAYISQLKGTSIRLLSLENGIHYSRDVDPYNFNAVTVIKKKGNQIFFAKTSLVDRLAAPTYWENTKWENPTWVGYCWQ